MNTHTSKHYLLIVACLLQTLFYGCTPDEGASFQSAWPESGERTWLGPEYWANRLQDWKVADARISCLASLADRNVQLLTHQLSEQAGDLHIRVRLGLLQNETTNRSWMGFKIGAKGEFNDYRDDAIRGKGLHAGITVTGRLFIGDPEAAIETSLSPEQLQAGIVLQATLKEGEKGYKLSLSAYKDDQSEALATTSQSIVYEAGTDSLNGNLALVSHFVDVEQGGSRESAWFADWEISGSKLEEHKDRAFGPVLFTQYALSRDILKITAQMPPMGSKDDDQVRLEIQVEGKWKSIAESPIDEDARTAHFRIENWDGTKDTPYRLLYAVWSEGNVLKPYTYEGMIRKEPTDQASFVIAGFTGNNDLGFPNTDISENVQKHNPDFLFFSGDQIYEGVAGYGVQRSPLDKSMLDYLRKWYLFGWAYGDLLRDRPSVAIPDDHDVYHGNIWGEGGKATDPTKGQGSEEQDTGGYKQPPEWVRMVERTQTSHLPDPYDPRPVKQNIGVYYTSIEYGGISFGVIEDRKFKSAPKGLMPEAEIHNGWAQNRDWDAARDGDVEGAVLLGARQLDFLENWSADWTHGSIMKVLLSQTIFANVATLPEEEYHDRVVPTLRILNADEYAPNDRPVSDMDSNGWPQTGRNKALEVIRKSFAFHLAGDQHLGSVIQYGIKDWRDAGFAFCVPAISNVWPRRWYPQEAGGQHEEGMPKYTGDFKDGFGNKMTVYAVSNPEFTGRKPSRLYDRATGYGIVRLNKNSRDITIECWPRGVDPTDSTSKQYKGWPMTINQMDNYGRKALAYLPKLQFDDMNDPVVQVVHEASKEIVYTIRIKGKTYRPAVFEMGTYSLYVGEPGTDRMKSFTAIKAASKANDSSLVVSFE